MSPDKEALLFENFPDIFRDYHGDMFETNMHWGICCGDGWFSLIWDLCDTLSKMPEASNLYLLQVKEKFGGLRFYLNSYTTRVMDIVGKAENRSFAVCEMCGAPGSMRDESGWYKVRCQNCL